MTVVSTFAFFSGKNIALDLRTAGDALANTFDERGKYIWALGLFASGQSSTLTGGLAGQFVIEVK
jgi:Mn2+/Fe2+ NRAMP family transporter